MNALHCWLVVFSVATVVTFVNGQGGINVMTECPTCCQYWHDPNCSVANCMHWAEIGECSNNPSYMHAMCDAMCAVTGSERCVDDNIMCHDWAQMGECDTNPQYMLESCKPSCGVCGAPPEGCVDGNDDFCPQWADAGECEANPSYMLQSCKLSCDACDDDAGSTDPVTDAPTNPADGDPTTAPDPGCIDDDELLDQALGSNFNTDVTCQQAVLDENIGYSAYFGKDEKERCGIDFNLQWDPSWPSSLLMSEICCTSCSTDQDDATESTDGDRTGGTLDHHEGTDAADYDSCEDITIAYKAMVIGAKEAARICDQKLCKTKGTQDNFKQCKRKKKKKCKGLSVSECEKGCKVRRKKNKKDKCIRS